MTRFCAGAIFWKDMTLNVPVFRLQAPPLAAALVQRPRVDEKILATPPGRPA